MERSGTLAGEKVAQEANGMREIQRLKPNSIGLLGVLFMVVATAAPISAMTVNVPLRLSGW